jgi:raffinose/stachyose/melibiose transport system permease protein
MATATTDRIGQNARPVASPGASARRRLAGRWLGHGVVYAILIVSLLIAIGPFVAIALAGFKTGAELASSPFGLPAHWTIDNFTSAWTQAHFSQYFRSSIFVAVPVVVGSTVLSVLSGYAFGRMQFPASRPLFFLMLLGIMIPGEAVIIPLYHNLRQMRLLDTYWAIILPQIAFSVSFGTFWMRGFFSQTPQDLVDAATVDGANSWQTLWDVLLPLARPAILSMAVLFFVWSWNDFLLPLVVVSREELRTLPLGLAFFQGRFASDLPLMAAGATLVALPTIVVYVLLQRHFIRGIASGAVK